MSSPVFGDIFDSAIFGGAGGLFASQFDYLIFDEDGADGIGPSVPQNPFAKAMVSDFMKPLAGFAI